MSNPTGRNMINTQDTRRVQAGHGLKSCPFCGSDQLRVWHLSSTVNVACTQCGAHGPDVEIDWSSDRGPVEAEVKAFAEWNKRRGRH